ncbi:hypothetical protein JXM67_13845 [candidate division WOR-3 bacterium]|nr:hypothetical protein [candidate division WOR-3 bacterium]
MNVGIKYGSRYVHNVLEYGLNPTGDYANNKTGLGLGGHVPLGRFFTDIDVTGYAINEGYLPVTEEGSSNLLTRLRITAGFAITPGIAVFAGPSLNFRFSPNWDGANVLLFGLPLAELDGANYNDLWLGFQIGIQIL